MAVIDNLCHSASVASDHTTRRRHRFFETQARRLPRHLERCRRQSRPISEESPRKAQRLRVQRETYVLPAYEGNSLVDLLRYRMRQ